MDEPSGNRLPSNMNEMNSNMMQRVTQASHSPPSSMTSSKYKRQRKAMFKIFEGMRLGEDEPNAASSASLSRQRRSGKQKRKLLPLWTSYVNDVWRPQERARIAEATNLDALHTVEQSIKDGLETPAYNLTSGVSPHRAKAFYEWLETGGACDDGGKDSTAHSPKEWQGIIAHLEAEKSRQIHKAKSSSKRTRRGAIKNLLGGEMSLSQLNAMGISTRGLKGL